MHFQENTCSPRSIHDFRRQMKTFKRRQIFDVFAPHLEPLFLSDVSPSVKESMDENKDFADGS